MKQSFFLLFTFRQRDNSDYQSYSRLLALERISAKDALKLPLFKNVKA